MNMPGEGKGDRFCALWEAWKGLAPKALARQNPLAVLALLEACEGRGGTFQMGIRSRIGLTDTQLSKLLHKLVHVRWITVMSSKKGNSAKHRIQITATGGKVLAELRRRMSNTPAGRAARKKKRRAVPSTNDQPNFLDELNCQFPDTEPAERSAG
jgi:DNA-binding MarR family transcriptional regulator